MSFTRITILLDQVEISALLRMAELDCRHPRDQVRFLLRAELERRGFLVGDNKENPTELGDTAGANTQ